MQLVGKKLEGGKGESWEFSLFSNPPTLDNILRR